MDEKETSRFGSAEIASALRQEILAGRYSAQDRLPAERLLADQFSVARGTIREALSMLATDGMLDIRPGSGSYVAPQALDETNSAVADAGPLELIDARFALEPHICRLAVLRGGRQDFDRMEAQIDIMDASAGNPTLFSDADAEFHGLLAKSTGNGLLNSIVRQINGVRNHDQWSLMRRLTLNESIIVQYNDQHRKILHAIRSREPDQAAALMKEHLSTARLSLTRAAAA